MRMALMFTKNYLNNYINMANLIDQVDEGFKYFGYRLEELKTDDVYYIEAFMRYIESLESKLKIAKKK
jgi:hypothetical protein